MEATLTFEPVVPTSVCSSRPLIISGPCSAETEEQLLATARGLAKQGVHVLRAGIWKPRTRPNAFEGVGSVGLQWLKKAKEETGLLTAVEVANVKHVYEALKFGVDILWIGARTTVNPFSVQEIADTLKGVDIPVLIKNPINPDLELWIGAIERIQQAGVKRIAAIHRGFSSHAKTAYRNMPQWNIPIELKRRYPDLQLICDPSHICGNRHMLFDVSQKALDLNYDGLIIESHIDPDNAWSDAKQQITPEVLGELLAKLVVRKPQSDNENFQHVLEELRTQIDQYDEELIQVLSQRMKVAESIGTYKRENNVTILQTNRWAEIVETMVAKGVKGGLSEPFVKTVLDAIHQESIQHQSKVMSGKNQ